jgi:hypothetical protein
MKEDMVQGFISLASCLDKNEEVFYNLYLP